jgi:hypothetical protein
LHIPLVAPQVRDRKGFAVSLQNGNKPGLE